MKIEAGKFYKTRDGRKAEAAWRGTSYHGPSSWMMRLESGGLYSVTDEGIEFSSQESGKDLIAEWTDEPRPWGELTDAEKVALVEAYRDGQQIELRHGRGDWLENDDPDWAHTCTYRIKPEPVVETVTLHGGLEYDNTVDGWVFDEFAGEDRQTHSITFTLSDGDCSSIKMERIK